MRGGGQGAHLRERHADALDHLDEEHQLRVAVRQKQQGGLRAGRGAIAFSRQIEKKRPPSLGGPLTRVRSSLHKVCAFLSFRNRQNSLKLKHITEIEDPFRN